MTLCAAKQVKFDDAERLFERCQAIQEKVLGPCWQSCVYVSTLPCGDWRRSLMLWVNV